MVVSDSKSVQEDASGGITVSTSDSVGVVGGGGGDSFSTQYSNETKTSNLNHIIGDTESSSYRINNQNTGLFLSSYQALIAFIDQKLILSVGCMESNVFEKHNFPHFFPRSVVIRLMLSLVVLLTFGLASPILGILIVISIGSESLVALVSMGRMMLLLNAQSRRNSIQSSSPSLALPTEKSMIYETLSYLFSSEHFQLYPTTLIVAWTVSLFWSFLLFDVLGDVYGSFWAGIACCIFGCCLPLLVFLLLWYLKWMSDVKKSLPDTIGIDSIDDDKIINSFLRPSTAAVSRNVSSLEESTNPFHL